MKTVVTFGTYDLFHVGHLNILRRAKDLGDRLVVGVSSDELNFRKKQIRPTYPLDHRMGDPTRHGRNSPLMKLGRRWHVDVPLPS